MLRHLPGPGCPRLLLLPSLVTALIIVSCQSPTQPETDAVQSVAADRAADEQAVAAVLDTLNARAARADYPGYFSLFTADATFLGTDATEHWDKSAFMTWSLPYFEKKKTWHFTTVDRHVYFGKTPGMAWFDELLDTQMKICRGSGVLVKDDAGWKIAQYVLSMTFPNEVVGQAVELKTPAEDSILNALTAAH